jgi:hypothetical protein
MPHDSDLYRELRKLRSRSGVDRGNLGRYLGPEIRRKCRLEGTERGAQIRTAVEEMLRTLIEGLAAHLQEAALWAFALERENKFPLLEDRVERLAHQQSISMRTARRRMDDALAAMAIAGEELTELPDNSSAKSGWRTSSLDVLCRLDTATPELYEMRTIVAAREIAEIVIRIGLPLAPDGAGGLRVETMFGARVRSVQRQHQSGNYTITLDLPEMLSHGQKQDIWLRFVLAPGQPIWPHYAIVPLDPCESGTIRVRFAPDRQPDEIWLLDDVPYTDLQVPPAKRDLIGPAALNEVCVRFSGLRQGHGYGIAWTPPAVSVREGHVDG